MQLPKRLRGGLPALSAVTAVLLAASAALATAPADARAGTASAEARSADPLLQDVNTIHGTGVVGVHAEVTSPDTRDIARAGTARRNTHKPMPWNGRFRIGSATKTFTATVVLQLVDEGRMSLDDTVEQWLPGVVQGNDNDGRQITVRQLLQHTSGIRDPEVAVLNSAAGYRAEWLRTYTPEELVAMAMRHAPAFAPGEDWSYSNTNYVLAAMIIHEVTDRHWAQEVHDRIIRPLGLNDTSTPGAFPRILGPHAQAYAAFDTDTSINVTGLNASMAVGSGSIISTTHDLSRFYSALLGGRLLDPAELEEMTTTVLAPELGVHYGLGLAEIPLPCGGSYFGHVGELLGYRTWVGATTDRRTAVVYATSDGNEHTQQAMSALVAQALCRTGS